MDNRNVSGGIVLMLLGAGLISLFATPKGKQILAIIGAKESKVDPNRDRSKDTPEPFGGNRGGSGTDLKTRGNLLG